MADAASPAPEPTKHKHRRHTWPQRLVLGVNLLVVMACFVSAAIIWYANHRLGERKVVALADPAATTIADTPGTPPPVTTTLPGDTAPPATAADEWTEPYTGDTSAKNFLITGESSNPCADGDPTAGAFGEEHDSTALTDSIMVIRISPATNQAAVLSLQRDLWVKISGTNSRRKINSAFDPNNPTILANTITENFGIPIDHYINIDLCMFKTLVDAIGGVNVPFQYHVYDPNTGLDAGPGCVNLTGSQALAWVRTRKLRYDDPVTGEERRDQSSDFGRISRQQDFLRRFAAKAISEGLTNPRAAATFIDQFIRYVITDSALTAGTMLDFVQAMHNLDPATIRTFQFELSSNNRNGLSTQDLSSGSDFNEQLLAVFRGEAELGSVGATPDTSVPSTDSTAATSPDSSVDTTLPVVNPEDNLQGIVPQDDPTCT